VRILALETATPLASAALIDAEGVLAEILLKAPMRQLEWLLPAVEGMLRDVEMGLGDIDAIAVSRGPGGFTGLRVGIVTATAWAWSRGIPVLGVGTLEALAAVAGTDDLVLPMLDAHRGEIAAGLYRGSSTGAPECILEPVVAPPAVVATEVMTALAGSAAGHGPAPANGRTSVLLVGDGLSRHGMALLGALGASARPGGPQLHPRAAVVGLIARARLLAGDHDDPWTIVPVYGRRPVAAPWQETSGRTGIGE
jgi:tRNA threonylcarbamoyladenosine biosynthesis protein TsaB